MSGPRERLHSICVHALRSALLTSMYFDNEKSGMYEVGSVVYSMLVLLLLSIDDDGDLARSRF